MFTHILPTNPRDFVLPNRPSLKKASQETNNPLPDLGMNLHEKEIKKMRIKLSTKFIKTISPPKLTNLQVHDPRCFATSYTKSSHVPSFLEFSPIDNPKYSKE